MIKYLLARASSPWMLNIRGRDATSWIIFFFNVSANLKKLKTSAFR